jgi:hypothetical protein
LGDKDCRQKLSPINRKIYPFPLWEPQPKSHPVGRFSNFPKNFPFFSERGRKNSNPLPNCPDLWEGISRPSIFLNLDRWERRGDFQISNFSLLGFLFTGKGKREGSIEGERGNFLPFFPSTPELSP